MRNLAGIERALAVGGGRRFLQTAQRIIGLGVDPDRKRAGVEVDVVGGELVACSLELATESCMRDIGGDGDRLLGSERPFVCFRPDIAEDEHGQRAWISESFFLQEQQIEIGAHRGTSLETVVFQGQGIAAHVMNVPVVRNADQAETEVARAWVTRADDLFLRQVDAASEIHRLAFGASRRLTALHEGRNVPGVLIALVADQRGFFQHFIGDVDGRQRHLRGLHCERLITDSFPQSREGMSPRWRGLDESE